MNNMIMVPMTDNEFQDFRQRSKNELVKQRAEDMNTSLAEAEPEAEAEVLRHLPEGRRTEKNYFYHLKSLDKKNYGYLWFGLRTKMKKQQIFIYDILIEEPFRGSGYGKFMLAWLEDEAKNLAATEITLHVLGYNKIARELYKNAGYEITNIYMAKTLI